MIPITLSPYIERRVRVPSFAADAAIDLMLLDLYPGTLSPADRTVELSRGRLVLDGLRSHPVPPSSSASWPARLLEGWIVAQRGFYRIRVEIELLPWSESASSLGMRPIVRRGSVLGLGPYLRLGTEAVEWLRDEIERRAGGREQVAA